MLGKAALADAPQNGRCPRAWGWPRFVLAAPPLLKSKTFPSSLGLPQWLPLGGHHLTRRPPLLPPWGGRARGVPRRELTRPLRLEEFTGEP